MSAGRLRILFATPECAPWVKTGGLGDVCGALPKALAQRGHDVRVLMPAFPVFAGLLQAPLDTLVLPAQGPWPAAHLHRVDAQGIQLWLLDVPSLYARPRGPYLDQAGQDYADNAERFGMLSHVAARLSHAGSPCEDWPVDVLHCHDWTTGLAPAYLLEMAGRQARAATVMTIHNLLFQGLFPSHLAPRLDMPPAWLTVDPGLLHWDRLCFLKAGLRCADRITTVSPTYAREIQTPEQGCGLDGMLRLRSADLVGILNGIDTTQWDPACDPLIVQTYDADTLSRKLRNKVALRERLGLSQDDDRMLLGLVSRMTAQKGIELLIEALPAILEMGCQLCVLGSGDKPMEEAMSALAIAHPGRVAVRIGFDEGLAHLIEAGADAFLMPSVFEPCGLNQLYSQAYGTPPIVHAVGGLADSVQEDVSTGNGFAFDTPSADAFLSAVQRAHAVYHQPQRWRRIQRNAMALDRSWGPSAQQYEAVYAAARLRARH